MDKNITLKSFVQSLNKEKIKNYLYPSIFFIVFSIFIIFAIKPSLSTVFSLLKEKEILTEKNQRYQDAVDYVSLNLSILESLRDSMYLLDEAFPNTPKISKIIEDLYKAGDVSNVKFISLNLANPIQYTLERKPILNKILINIESEGEFEDIIKLIGEIKNQRRIKIIKNVEIMANDKISTESSKLNIKVQFEGYYL